MTLSVLGFCCWDWAVLGCCGIWVFGGREAEYFPVCENTHAHIHTHTQNISMLTCFHCPHLRAFVTVTFGSHLIFAAPLAPLSHIPLLFSWGFFQASLLTVSPRPCASLSPLCLLALFLSTFSAFPAFTLILAFILLLLLWVFSFFLPLFLPVTLPLSLFLPFSSPLHYTCPLPLFIL